MTEKKPKSQWLPRGRPALPVGKVKRVVVSVRMQPAEYAKIRKGAMAAGLSIADFIMAPHRRA